MSYIKSKIAIALILLAASYSMPSENVLSLYQEKATIATIKGNYKKAAKYYKKQQDMGMKDALTYCNLANMLYLIDKENSNNDNNEKIMQLLSYAESTASNQNDYISIASLYFKIKKDNRAMEILNNYKSGNTYYYYSAAVLLREYGHVKISNEYFKKLCESINENMIEQ